MGRRREDPLSCWDRALRLLSRQESSCLRLRRKLEQRNYETEDIDATLSRLVECGYLDDRRFGLRWAEERLRRGPVGGRRLRADLESRGVGGDLASEIAAKLLPDGDLEATNQAAEAWLRRRGGDLRALARHLDRLGFTGASVGAVISAARGRLDELALPESDRKAEP